MYNDKYFKPLMDGDTDEEKNKEEKKPEGGQTAKELEKILLEQRKIFFWGVVEEKNCRDAMNKLLLLENLKPGEEIKMYINSPGGSITDGMVVYDTMQMISSPVTTICLGMCASMGAILLSGGKKGSRYIYPSGEVMIHQPSLGGYMQGVTADLEIHAEQMRKAKEQSARLLAANCGRTFEEIMKDFDRDYWMNAQEAINYGIVDQVLTKL